MQIHESTTCHVYKALNDIHMQCSAGHVPVYTSDHALMLCHAVHFTVYTLTEHNIVGYNYSELHITVTTTSPTPVLLSSAGLFSLKFLV